MYIAKKKSYLFSSTAGPDISNVSVFTDDEAESSGDCSSSDEEIKYITFLFKWLFSLSH
jgi:hypothetical protein